jgi:hypothetical protein
VLRLCLQLLVLDWACSMPALDWAQYLTEHRHMDKTILDSGRDHEESLAQHPPLLSVALYQSKNVEDPEISKKCSSNN